MQKKIIIISDTHQSHKLINKLVTKCEKFKPDLIMHLGDDFIDGEAFSTLETPLIQIPGTWCPQYEIDSIDNRRFETILGWKFFLTHTPTPHYKDIPNDINPLTVITSESCDFFLHGHTHQPEIHRKGKVTIINPGHCKEKDNRGFEPTYAYLYLTETKCQIQILTLEDDKCMKEMLISK